MSLCPLHNGKTHDTVELDLFKILFMDLSLVLSVHLLVQKDCTIDKIGLIVDYSYIT